MKKLVLFLIGLALMQVSFAQAPQKLSYQSVIRDASNALVTDAAVGIQISIVQGSPAGAAVFVETHTPTTNANGLASLEIGGGIPVIGTLDGVDWGNGPYYIKSETDPSGGTNYTLSGTTELLSVPYALYAANAGSDGSWTISADTLSTDKWVGIGTDSPNAAMHIKADNEETSLRIETTGLTPFGEFPFPRPYAASIDLKNENDEFEIGLLNSGLTITQNTSEDPDISINNGRVGIGTNASNFGKLTVDGTLRVRNAIRAFDGEGIKFRTDDAVARITMADNGRIGIGEESPEGLLHLTGAAGVLPTILFQGGSEDIAYQPGSALQFGTWDIGSSTWNERMRLNSVGLQFGSYSTADDQYLKISTQGGNSFRSGIRLRHFDDDNGFDIVSDERNNNYGLHFIDRSFLYPLGITAMFIDKGTGKVGFGTTNPLGALNIVSNQSGDRTQFDSYALNLSCPSNGHGINIKIDDNTMSKTNNFVQFVDGNNFVVGGIRGFSVEEDYNPPPISQTNNFICYVNGLLGGTFPTDPIALALLPSQILLNLGCKDGGVIYESGFGDYAEYLEKIDTSEYMEFGDIVGVRNGKITKNTEDAEQFMSVSLAPIVLGNAPPEEERWKYKKVGFMGQVPIKIRGAVHSGDYIIPSGLNNGEGIAISPEDLTLDQIGMVIGRSWSDSEYEGLNMVNAVIGVKSFEIVEVLKKELKRMDDLETTVKSLKEQNEAQASALQENTEVLKEIQGFLNAKAQR